MTSPHQAPDPAALGVRWCLALLDGLIAGGVRDLVLSPGSRSTPMVIAAQARRGLSLTPILDERSAGFFALGLARGCGRPVALLATSGSAPAHWYAAVIEAEAAGVPLVLISADRPPELQGWGANQTIDQNRLFGTRARAFHDPGAPVDLPLALDGLLRLGLRAARESLGPHPGPVHINLPLREPLVPRQPIAFDPPPQGHADTDTERVPAAATCEGPHTLPIPGQLTRHLRGRGMIYCGPGSPDADLAEALWSAAAALGVPVLTDPLCGLRFGPAAHGTRVTRYKLISRNAAAARALRPDWVLRIGRPPISKTVSQWLAGVPVILIDPGRRWADPGHDLTVHLDLSPAPLLRALAADPPAPADPAWRALWHQAETAAARAADAWLDAAPWCEAQVIRDLAAGLPAGDGLLVGNSLPIRQFETWSGGRDAPLAIFGNRGASGIDGQASTLAGINAAGIPTSALLGDLSLLHDLSGLLLLPPLDRPLVVVNNGGGRIFDYLPQAGLPDFERLWRTPRPVPFDALAATFGLGYRRAADGDTWGRLWAETRAAIAAGTPCPLIELTIDAAASQAMHLEFRQRIALTPLLP